jgi:ferric-dicitrate binding protein FerR (iron transport regulator)
MTAESVTSPQLLIEQAAEWFIRARDEKLSMADRDAYMDWLNASPTHVAELLRVRLLYNWVRRAKLQYTIADDADEAAEARVAIELASRHASETQRHHSARTLVLTRVRRITAVAAIIATGVGTFDLFWSGVHLANISLEGLIPLSTTMRIAIPVAVSVLVTAAGAAIGLRAVRLRAIE